MQALQNKKSPVPDGVPSEVLKVVYQHSPQLSLPMINACLTDGISSACWKVVWLVLISKGNPGLPSFCWSLCMLDLAGKVFEKLIKARLLPAIQLEICHQRSMVLEQGSNVLVDVIHEVTEAVRRGKDYNQFSCQIFLLVTLNMRKTFNSATWGNMLQAMEETFFVPGYLMRVVNNYLKDHSLLYQTRKGQLKIMVIAGAEQESILVPDLWNMSNNSLLKAEMIFLFFFDVLL